MVKDRLKTFFNRNWGAETGSFFLKIEHYGKNRKGQVDIWPRYRLCLARPSLNEPSGYWTTISCKILADKGIPKVYHSFLSAAPRINLHLMQKLKNTRQRERGTLQKHIAQETFRLCVSLNRDEYERITAAAAQGGIGMAAYVRAMVFKGRLIARLTEEEKALFRDMICISRDLSRLTKMAEEQGMSETQPILARYCESVDKLLNKIKL